MNFRPLVCCAFGLAFGVFLYGRCRFGGLVPSDFLLLALFLGALLWGMPARRAAALLLSVLLFAGAGVLSLHLYTERFTSARAGEAQVSGVVLRVTERHGYCLAVLGDLFFDGKAAGGKCRLTLSDAPRPGDVLLFSADLETVAPEESYLFSQDIRYTARADEPQVTGRTQNPFLRLNAALYSVLHAELDPDGADVVYALLTGNSSSMDEGVLTEVRRGGIAHIFAVSGMHIGMVFGAACLLFRPLKKYRFLPASLLAFGYAALCNFTVSSVRAATVCAAFGLNRTFGRKNDFLQSLSLAAIFILLFAPAEWYSAGFRLTFGACLGLALFSSPLGRLMNKLRVPRLLSGYLASCLAVQLVLIPIEMESFGYLPVWGLLLNPLLLPLLPVFFFGCLVPAFCAIILPPAAGILLALPRGMLALFFAFVSLTEFSAVISGFTLGAGATVWAVAAVLLSEKFRMSARSRAVWAAGLAVLFTIAVVCENVVFAGCKIELFEGREGRVALVETRTERVLIVGGVTLKECEDFLLRTGTPDVAVVLSEEWTALQAAAFLPVGTVYARDCVETGLREREIVFCEEFSVGELGFRFESREKLLLRAEGVYVEIDFSGVPALGADYFVGGSAETLYLKDGKLYG